MTIFKSKKLILMVIFSLLLMAFAVKAEEGDAAAEASPDEGVLSKDDCLKCHGYKDIAITRPDGSSKFFYINGDMFERTVHGNVSCKDCHDIDEIPHKPIDERNRVWCGKQCHLIEPSQKDTNTPFSHAPIYNIFKESVHSRGECYTKDGQPVADDDYNQDAPACKNCHSNPVYNLREDGSVAEIIPENVRRCMACHPGPMKSDGTASNLFAYRFYRHVTHRLQASTRRSPLGVVELCSKCHANKALMKKHNVNANAVDTYKDTFHWKAVKLGHQKTAHCLSCHSLPDHSVHDLKRHTDPQAATYLHYTDKEKTNVDWSKSNRQKTCGYYEGPVVSNFKGGCHPISAADGNLELARYDVHLVPKLKKGTYTEYLVFEMFFWLTFGTVSFLLIVIFLELLRRIFPPKRHQ
ncbi:MAG: hypothetical protein HY934_00310 [Candidatus Firestonebacteria bacterium]|nr:hypothetical protein [Candidatus Firestonebacteria bacterium]